MPKDLYRRTMSADHGGVVYREEHQIQIFISTASIRKNGAAAAAAASERCRQSSSTACVVRD